MKHHITNKKRKTSVKSLTRRKTKKTKKTRKARKKAPVLKDNFYYYVNNNWFSNTFISESDTDKSNFTVVQKKVNNEL